jgi:hypothetical protein
MVDRNVTVCSACLQQQRDANWNYASPTAHCCDNPVPPPADLEDFMQACIVISRAPNEGVKSRSSIEVTIEQQPGEWEASDSE